MHRRFGFNILILLLINNFNMSDEIKVEEKLEEPTKIEKQNDPEKVQEIKQVWFQV